MRKTTSSRRFGGVFEHSPWIAERAYGLELGPRTTRADGLHIALAGYSARPAEAERLGVLHAHPDLAGKLAAARAPALKSTANRPPPASTR